MTPEKFDNIERLWAVKVIVEAANNKCQELCADTASVPAQSVLDIMHLVADATAKASHMRWTNADGLYHAVEIYVQAIKNI